ncbi:MAG TPA: hypothetical protein VE172_19065 [Stackebrandtia sp.]|uniref:hypothetical protein n=1 Tax=Stackebrandtia sp. TaxID=2023065 RepID=UPI002D65DCC7|nr:hypothetical protein [Stackebrandtia sp.]HZE40904.1 hypothetical protein [Stackebrandtia sp.]
MNAGNGDADMKPEDVFGHVLDLRSTATRLGTSIDAADHGITMEMQDLETTSAFKDFKTKEVKNCRDVKERLDKHAGAMQVTVTNYRALDQTKVENWLQGKK